MTGLKQQIVSLKSALADSQESEANLRVLLSNSLELETELRMQLSRMQTAFDASVKSHVEVLAGDWCASFFHLKAEHESVHNE